MERMEGDVMRTVADDSLELCTHGFHSGVCIRNGQNAMRRRVGELQNIGYPKRQDGGLACARPGNDHHWTLDRIDGLLLLGVEGFVTEIEFIH